jgi:hypothetical protein
MLLRLIIEEIQQAVSEPFAAFEQVLKCDCPAGWPVVEKQVNRFAGWQDRPVWLAWVDLPSANINPGVVVSAQRANSGSLPRFKDGEPDPLLGQCLKGWHINRRFGQPHPFRITTETVPEVTNAPDHLGLFVPDVGERHDRVVINLGERRSVALEPGLAQFIRLDNCPVKIRVVSFHPAQQGRAKVETDVGVVIDDL